MPIVSARSDLARLRRAVGAYGDETLAEFGILLMQVAMIERLRRTPEIYAPPKYLVPSNLSYLRARTRGIISELSSANISRSWMDFVVDSSIYKNIERQLSWNDPLQLSAIAVALKPDDVDVHITYAANLIISGSPRQACANLTIARSSAGIGHKQIARALRTEAALYDYANTPRVALDITLEALRLDPNNEIIKLDCLCYALAGREKEKFIALLTRWISTETEIAEQLLMRLARRPNSTARHVFISDTRLQEVTQVLRSGAPQHRIRAIHDTARAA